MFSVLSPASLSFDGEGGGMSCKREALSLFYSLYLDAIIVEFEGDVASLKTNRPLPLVKGKGDTSGFQKGLDAPGCLQGTRAT